MKQKILIVAVVVLSVVLALVIGLAVKLELDAAKSDPAPVTTTDANVPTESTAETTPDETTQPTATVPQDTQPAVTEPEDEYTWPMDDVDIITQPTNPSPTTQPANPPATEPEPTSGFPGGAGGPNEGEFDPIL